MSIEKLIKVKYFPKAFLTLYDLQIKKLGNFSPI